MKLWEKKEEEKSRRRRKKEKEVDKQEGKEEMRWEREII